MQIELNGSNFIIYAAKNYYTPRCIDSEEFYEELNRFKYINRLINRYRNGGEICERLILNHVTIILNVFGNEPGTIMLMYKVGGQNLSIVKPFLEYLNALKEGDLINVTSDEYIVRKLENL
jgi:hypothetical protein